MRSLTLVRKNLFRRKLRFFLLFTSILIAFFLFGVLMSIRDVATTGGDGVQPDRMVTINKINFTQPLPLSYVSRIRAIKDVQLATHASWFGGYYKEPRNFLIVFAVEPETYLQVYPELTVGADSKEKFLKDRTAMLVGKATADKYGWKVGQRIPLFSNIYAQKSGSRSWDFVVAGIMTSAKKNTSTDFIIFNYDYLNETRSFAVDTIGQVIFLTGDPARNAPVKAVIDQSFANSSYATDTITEQQFAASFLGQLGNITFIISLVVGVSFLTILIIVGNTLVMAVRERTREIGILKTLGFSAQRILAMVIGESMLIALIGGFAGLLLAYAMIAALASSGAMSGISMNPNVWLMGFLCIIALGALTAAIPAYNALRLNIVTALGRK